MHGLQDMDVNEIQCEQDGVTRRTGREAIQLLQEPFPERVIPPSGCSKVAVQIMQFNVVGFSVLWEFLKPKIYANWPTVTYASEKEIGRSVNKIHPHSCKMVMEKFSTKECVCVSKAVETICPV